jgi:MYXO-CTERM domain-containing protein
MIGDRSRAWWQHFSAAGVLIALASCSSESIQQQDPIDMDEPGALQGELAVYIADYNDGTSETRYFLRDAKGAEQRLTVTGEIDAAPGRKLKVWGKQRGERLEVSKYKIVEDAGEGIGSQRQPIELIDATAKAGRVMCAGQINLNGGTAKMTVASVKAGFHATTGASANTYYRENSFGQVGLAGDSYGPFAYGSYSSCDGSYSALATAIRPMLDSASPTKCDQYAFVMGPDSACGWLGLGQVGTSDKPATDTWYIDSVGCTVAVQEPGHNYGMQHSSSITCGSAPFADSLSSCTHSEYGDKYDTMGGGCYHMNAWQKLYQKWFGGCNGVKVSATGTFNLYPIEAPCNGVQVLQVPFPGAKTRTFQSTTLTSYYVELRTATGFDNKYGSPSVLIHAGGAPILPNSSNPKGLHTWAIAAGGTSTWGLTAGKSFADPAGGLTITATSVSATSAVVDINYTSGSGSPTCLDGNNTPFVAPGATDCTAPPTIGDASPPPPTVDARTDTGTGGTAGAGMDAAGGTGGTGAAGAAGAAGMAGSGGSAGKGGGGTGGSGGSGGSTGGTGGSTGGTGGTGTGGTDTGGSGGDSGRGASGGTKPPTPEPLSGGCGCRVASADPLAGARSSSLVLLGLAGLFGARRRNRRQRNG